MAKELWTAESLELYASNYIINEHSIRNRTSNKLYPSNVDKSSSQEYPQWWHEFRTHLFKEVRRRVREEVLAGRHPLCALKNAPHATSSIAHRHTQLKYAIQAEVYTPDSPVRTWAIRQLVIRLGRVATAYRCEPRTLPARLLARALFEMRMNSAPVMCTRAQLVDVWQRLCTLKSWQLYRLVRAGDKPLDVPAAERLGAADWTLLDAMLLHDGDDRTQLVTVKALQYVECYRALVVLVRVLAMVPAGVQRSRPWRPRAMQLLWSRVHARYASTGRTASMILLQRRWHQLRLLVRTVQDEGVNPLHPLLQLVASEFSVVVSERVDSWSDVVHSHHYVLAGSDSIAKQERKSHWYTDFRILEQLNTVNEIDEYIKRRLHYCQEQHKCGFWEHPDCSFSETCENNIPKQDISHNLTIHKIYEVRKETQRNGNVCMNINMKHDAATIHALERLDPTSTQVTVVVESDAYEDKPQLHLGAVQVEDAQIGSRENLHDAKDNKPLKIVRTYINKKLRKAQVQTHCVQDVIDEKKIVMCRQLDVDGVRNKELAKSNGGDLLNENTVMSKTKANLNEMEHIIDKGYSNETTYTPIDNKLLHVTHVKLTRIDETIAWRKHARNNTIDLGRAGLHGESLCHRESPVPAQNISIENEFDDIRSEASMKNDNEINSVVETVCESHNRSSNTKHEDVSEAVSKTQRLLRLCKPAIVKLRHLKGSDIPRRGRVVKKVELADIDEVRRINSNILTAQVKPIPLNNQINENVLCIEEEEGGKREAKFMDLTKELEQLDKDMMALFYISPEAMEDLINEAINSDLNINNADKKQWNLKNTSSNAEVASSFKPSELFLDDDEVDMDDVDELIEPPKKQRIMTKKMKTKTATKKTKMKSKKKKTRAKKKKNQGDEQATPDELPVVLTAFEEWERQKQIANKYFEIGTLVKDTDKKKTKPQTVCLNTNKEGIVPPKLITVLADGLLTRLHNAPIMEPPAVNSESVVIPPMTTTNQTEAADSDYINFVKPRGDAVNVAGITPMITGVCSLADTETIQDDGANTPSEDMNEIPRMTDVSSIDIKDPKLTISLTPMDRNIMVKVGDQLVCNTLDRKPSVLKVKVSSNPNNVDNSLRTDPTPSKQSFLKQFPAQPPQPPMSSLRVTSYEPRKHRNKEMVATAGREGSAAVTPGSAAASDAGPFVLASTSTKLTAEVTTPEDYVRTDRRKLLSVAKLDSSEPVWAVNKQYVLLTEQNLPCKSPSFWTMGRDPPGPCQFLVWPNNIRMIENKENTVTKYTQNSVEVRGDGNTNDVNMSNINNNSELNSVKVINESIIFNNQLNNCFKNESDNFGEIANRINNINDSGVCEPSSNDLNFAGVIQANTSINHTNKHYVDEDDSDSDSESNKLQIVEENDDIEDSTDAKCAAANETEHSYDNVSVNLDNGTTFDNTDANVSNKDLTRGTQSKPTDTVASNNGGHTRTMIKVKSFANVGRMEPTPVTWDADGNPDIIENNCKFYKKLLDAPASGGSAAGNPTYALMLSVVSSAEECERLLRSGIPMQVLERYRGVVYPLDVTTFYSGSPVDPFRLRHHDEGFLNDLAVKLQAFSASNPHGNSPIYLFVQADRPGDWSSADE